MAAKEPRSPGDEPAGKGHPVKADWRRATPRSAPAPAAGKKSGGAWRVKPDQAYQDARRWYRIRVASWILFVLALSIAFLVVILYRPRRTPLVAMAVTDYERQASLAVPPNGWAQEDVDSFRDLDTHQEIIEYSNPACQSDKTSTEAFAGLREEIRRQSSGRSRGYPIIVYLSVHGVVNQDGKPCLLLPGDAPLASDKWLPLESLVAYLFPPDGQEARPRKKLLILDCNRMDANWRLGLLYNSFADGLQEVVQKTPGLAILNSTAPGQIGWTSAEQLHGSVFAYFVWQGLRGAADRSDEKCGGDDNGDVSLEELYRYVQQRVRQWVIEHRADIQTPELYTEEKDFFLVHAKHGPPTEIPPIKGDFKARWAADIDPLWSKHAALRAASPWRVHPLEWERFQQGLLRLEQLAVAGNAYEQEYVRLKEELNAKVESLTDQEPHKDLAVASIPLRQEFAVGAERRKVADEQKTLRAQWNPAERRFAAESMRDVSYLAAAAEVWRQCVAGVDGARWPNLIQFVDADSRRGRSAGEVVELHYLRMLNDHLDPVAWKSHPAAVQRSLAVRDLAEKAAAPADERVHYWVQPAVDKADNERRRAEDQLFVGSSEAIQEAQHALDNLASSDGKIGAYPEALRHAEKVAQAFSLRDRSWAETPYYARWLLARLRPEDERSKDQKRRLDALIKDTHALGKELDRAIARKDWSAAWEPSYRAAQSGRDGLAKDFQEECTWLAERAPENRSTLQAIAVVLSVPLISGEQRQTLWKNYWSIAEKKHEIADEGPTSPGSREEKGKAEGAGGPKGEVFRVAGGASKEATAAYLKRLPASHPALAALVRSSLDIEDPPCLKAASDVAAVRGSSDEVAAQLSRLAKQGQCVREVLALDNDSVFKRCAAWLKESDARLDAGGRATGEYREGRAKADRLVRAAAPLMDLGRSPWDKPENDPAHQLRRLDVWDLLSWQAYRTLEDFWGPPPVRPDAPGGSRPPSFFETATEQYLASCTALCPIAKKLRYESADLKEAVDLRERLEIRKKAAAAALVPKATDLSIKKADAAVSGPSTTTTPGDLGAEIADHLPEGTAALYLRDPATASRADQTIPMLIQREQSRTDVRRIGIAVKAGQRTLAEKYSVPSDDSRLKHARLKAVGLYRGHEYTTDFTATPPDFELVYAPPVYGPPAITVFGEAGEPCPVVFVFDCSASMEENISDIRKERKKPSQIRAAAPAKVARFAIARDALKAILDRLAKSEIPYEVGLIAYGHRVGWSPENDKVLVVWDPKSPGKMIPKPDTDPLVPAEDVEVLRSPSPFGAAELAGLTKDLDALRPLGETPLYLAIQTALAELQSKKPFQGPGRTARRHVVVITDGINEVNGPGKRVLKTDLADLLRRPENRDVALDIVGFNLKDWDLVWQRIDRDDNRLKLAASVAPLEQQQVEAIDALKQVAPALISSLESFQTKRRELQELVAETKRPDSVPGTRVETSKGFYEVDEDSGVSAIVDVLRQSLELRRAKYTVDRVGDAVGVAGAELGQSVTLEKHAGVKRYLVKLGEGDRNVSTEVTLEGGESETLYLSKDGSQLEHRRYDKNLQTKSENIPDPSDPENRAKRFFIGVHYTDWQGSAVPFEISVQSNDPTRFSPRPEEAWIDVRPLAPEGVPTPAPYVVYDLTYVQKVPVPVLTFLAPDWPAAAQEAEVQLWFKLKRTPPDPIQGITVDDLRKRGGFRLPELPTTTFTADIRPGEQGAPYQVVVTERHPPDKPIEGARVEMDPAPVRVARQFNQKAGTVHHTFSYDAAVAAQAGTFRILLTSHVRLSERAVTLPSSLKVRIARRSR